MPRNVSTVLRRFTKQLIMPESHSPAEQLTRRNQERRIPQQVVKTGSQTPRTQGMKKHSLWVIRLVRMVLMPQIAPGMLGIKKLSQFSS
jgi:hypothetical protein